MSREYMRNLLVELAEKCGAPVEPDSAKAKQISQWLSQWGSRDDDEQRHAINLAAKTSKHGWPSYAELRDAFQVARTSAMRESSEPEGQVCDWCRGSGFVSRREPEPMYQGREISCAYACPCPAGDRLRVDYRDPQSGSVRRALATGEWARGEAAQ